MAFWKQSLLDFIEKAFAITFLLLSEDRIDRVDALACIFLILLALMFMETLFKVVFCLVVKAFELFLTKSTEERSSK